MKKYFFTKLMIFLFGVISLFWILGSIAMFASTDQTLSNRMGGGILFLILAIIFVISFLITLNKYCKNTKADRVSKREHQKLIQEEQMQLKYKEILDHKERINKLTVDNLVREKHIDNIKEQAQKSIEVESNKELKPQRQMQTEQLNPAEILLLKIDSISTSGIYFENIACRLLKANEFENIRNTPASGDYGIDILAEKDGISYAIQCKCYSKNIGNKAVQEAFSGSQFYNCMIAVVFTNSYFTKAAIETAKATKVLLWDRDKLMQMINSLSDSDLKELTNTNDIQI